VTDPLVVTLALDDAAQQHFDGLRRRHFPPERNHLGAHVTLFHALPGARVERVGADLARAAQRPAYPVEVTGVRSLGRGVAFALASPDLDAVRAGLAADWRDWLTAQDRQRSAAHVTVQNKVTPQQARSLLGELRSGFAPYAVQARGLRLWHYRGGPWEAAGEWDFEPPAPGGG
jgi:2'-5' RNA ligase